MPHRTALAELLAVRKGFSSATPETARWFPAAGIEAEVEFTAVDSMSCSFRELRLAVSALRDAPFDALKTWGDSVCQRVTYLLEHIGALEHDATAQTVLIRSTPPARQPDRTTFYEVTLQAPGYLTLRRYRTTPTEPRQRIDLQMTHEVLEKLVQDIVETVPAAT